ncbi:MAG TPA: hypothetical protein VFY29_03100 [Terriglobia bacterium]|nr:hypothetical protein [Terriglobia bacterium]
MSRLGTVFVMMVFFACASATPASQTQERFRVSLTFQGYWSEAYCRLDVEAGQKSEPAQARLECGRDSRSLFVVREALNSTETEQFVSLAAEPRVWNGPVIGRDSRASDGSVEWLERQSPHSWDCVVTSGNSDFGVTSANVARSRFLKLLGDIRSRMRDRGTLTPSRAEDPPPPAESIDGLWVSGQMFMALKKDGDGVVGWLLSGGRPLPIGKGTADGDTVMFKLRDGVLSDATLTTYTVRRTAAELNVTKIIDGVDPATNGGAVRTFNARRVVMSQPPL